MVDVCFCFRVQIVEVSHVNCYPGSGKHRFYFFTPSFLILSFRTNSPTVKEWVEEWWPLILLGGIIVFVVGVECLCHITNFSYPRKN